MLGMTPAMLAAIRPHLTLFGPAEPSPATADPVVSAALAAIILAGQGASPGNRTPPDVLTVRITALAFGPRNARATCSAIARIGAMLPADTKCLLVSGVSIEARASGYVLKAPGRISDRKNPASSAGSFGEVALEAYSPARQRGDRASLGTSSTKRGRGA